VFDVVIGVVMVVMGNRSGGRQRRQCDPAPGRDSRSKCCWSGAW